VEQSIGVFGENVLLWTCLLVQTPQRPQADVVHGQAVHLLNELKRSPEALQLPVQSVEDGMFAIAALIDEFAMALPDLRPYWSQVPLQASFFTTNSAGVEVYQRLERVRQGPKAVLATYTAVLGIGFCGCYGLPGADRYALAQLRRDLSTELGVDPDRDWTGGVLAPIRVQEVERLELFKEPWWRKLWTGRALAILFAIGGAVALAIIISGQVS